MDKILSPIKGRVEKYLNYKGITKELFFSDTGISSSNFKGSGRKSELGGDKIAKILTIYPDLNSGWLLTGKGDMLKGSDRATEISGTPGAEEMIRVSVMVELLREKDAQLRAKDLQIKGMIDLLKKGAEDAEGYDPAVPEAASK